MGLFDQTDPNRPTQPSRVGSSGPITPRPAGPQQPIGSPQQGLTSIIDWLGDTALMDQIRKSTLQVQSPTDMTPQEITNTVTNPAARPIGPTGPMMSEDQVLSTVPTGRAPVVAGSEADSERTAGDIESARARNMQISYAAEGLKLAAKGQKKGPSGPSGSTNPTGGRVELTPMARKKRKPFLGGSPSVTTSIFGGF